jgi:cholesterol oxidase
VTTNAALTERPMRDRVYTIQTAAGPRETELCSLQTADKVQISVSRLRHPNARAAVLLGHGLTTSSDMFVMPEHRNLAAFLHDEGYEVWAADFRMSNHYPYNAERAYTFDDAALYDWPALVKLVRSKMSGRKLHVIAHCLGSATFHASLYGLQLRDPGSTTDWVDSVISNSISLHPRVHWWSFIKLVVAPFAVERLLRLPYLDPGWADHTSINRSWRGRLLARLAERAHLECNSHACNILSFLWGTGFPALYQHDNMLPHTHDRLADLFGPVGMTYFRNVRKGALWWNRALVRCGKDDRLPKRYFDNVHDVKVPTLLVQGVHNHIFPGANRVTFERARAVGATQFRYHEFDAYGHQDVFMGGACDRDTFPTFAKFLAEHT